MSTPSYIDTESGFSVFFGSKKGIIMVACRYSATFVFSVLGFLELGFLYQMLMVFVSSLENVDLILLKILTWMGN